MNISWSRFFVIAPAVLLLLVGVSSVAFAWGAGSKSAAPVMPPRPTASTGANQISPGGPNGRGGSALLVVGTVASKTPSTFVVATTAGKSVTIDVTSTTNFQVRGVAGATIADIAVGSQISVQGSYQSDGTFTATAIQSGRIRGGRGFGGNGGVPRPQPSAAASGGSI
jgi:hypothetical protein